MVAIKNAVLVMRDHLIPNAVLLMEDGIIKAFGEARKLEIPEGCEVIDAEGLYVGPGFVDIHTHSDGKVFFYDEPKAVVPLYNDSFVMRNKLLTSSDTSPTRNV